MTASLIDFDTTIAYSSGDAPTQVAPVGTLISTDGDLSQSKLNVGLVGAGGADRLMLVEEKGLSILDGAVRYRGVPIGNLSANPQRSMLQFAFNDEVTREAVQAILRAVRYYNISITMNIVDRKAEIQLIDSQENMSAQISTTIHVSAEVLDLAAVDYKVGAAATPVFASSLLADPALQTSYSQLLVGLGLAGGADRLTLLPVRGLTISGSSVSYLGVPIGSLRRGQGSSPLIVQFNDTASLAAIETVIHNVAYYNTSGTMRTHDRFAQFELQDKLGAIVQKPTVSLRIIEPVSQETPTVYSVGNPAQVARPDWPTVGSGQIQNAELIVALGLAGGADRLTLVNHGDVSVMNQVVCYQSVPIGTFRLDALRTTMTIQFTEAVTPAALEAVLKSIAYYNTSSSMRVYDRTIDYRLIDAQGQMSLLGSHTIQVTSTLRPGYSDEFNDTGLDANKWRANVNSWSPYWSWRSDADHVSVRDGQLHINAAYAPHTRNGKTVLYESGIIQTTAEPVLYGYFEARIRATSTHLGVSPAFWLYNTDDESHTEIDVVELTENKEPNRAWFNQHVFRLPGETERNHRKVRQFVDLPFNPIEDFHVYGCEWTMETIRWYVDGVQVASQPNLTMHQPMNMAISLGIRAPLYAHPTADGFPAGFHVDYVRSWSEKP